MCGKSTADNLDFPRTDENSSDSSGSEIEININTLMQELVENHIKSHLAPISWQLEGVTRLIQEIAKRILQLQQEWRVLELTFQQPEPRSTFVNLLHVCFTCWMRVSNLRFMWMVLPRYLVAFVGVIFSVFIILV